MPRVGTRRQKKQVQNDHIALNKDKPFCWWHPRLLLLLSFSSYLFFTHFPLQKPMAHLANVNGVSDTLLKFPTIQRIPRILKTNGVVCNGTDESQQVQITRRVAIGLASSSIPLLANSINNVSLAQDNAYWTTDLLRIPPVHNSKQFHSSKLKQCCCSIKQTSC